MQFKISSPFPECTASTSHPHLHPLVSHLSEPGPPFHPFSVGLRGQSSCSSSLKCDQQRPPMQRLPMLEKHQTVKKNEVTFLLTTTAPSIRKCCYIEKNVSLFFFFLGPLQFFRRPTCGPSALEGPTHLKVPVRRAGGGA